ncbi:MAG: type II toxin-antitoxin system ParD family antitoxin [Planctomycetes bacterium]|nr:type II toxin-antitoxin system ParD family antitoxin [Planctomycetota bacterium]
MAVQLGSEIDQLIDERMASGRYTSREEVVYKALRMLTEHEATLADIRRGLEEARAGLGRPIEEFDAEFRARYGIPDQP